MSNDIRKINLDLLRPSPTQPRKHFDQAELDSLTNSMRRHGFAFGALLVRPIADDLFEIVVGERRARAAKTAGLSEVPCQVRELSNTKVLELQLIENLKRADLNPIEEAEGYWQLLKLVDEKTGALVHTIETAALEIGRDVAVITKQLTLCNLDPEARAAVAEKRLPARTAYLIGRIPNASLRAEATRAILHPEAGEMENGVLSLRDAEDLIARKFQRDLRRAPFDQEDPDLVPLRLDQLNTRTAGGACDDCPFKTGNIPGTDSQRKNSCLNPSCYDEKIDAEWTRWQIANTDPEKKRRALDRATSLETFSSQFPDQPTWSSGFVALNQYPVSDDLKAGEESSAPWRELIKGAELEIIIARDRKYKVHECVDRKLAIEAAQANGHDFFKSSDRATKPKPTRQAIGLEPPADLAAEEGLSLDQTRERWLNTTAPRDEVEAQKKKQEMARAETENRQKTVVLALLEVLRKKARFNTAFLRKIALFVFASRASTDEQLLKRYRLPVTDDISRNTAKWRDPELITFLVDLIVTDGGHNFDLDEDDRSWFKLFGIDACAEEKRLAKLDAKFKAADKKNLAKALAKK